MQVAYNITAKVQPINSTVVERFETVKVKGSDLNECYQKFYNECLVDAMDGEPFDVVELKFALAEV